MAAMDASFAQGMHAALWPKVSQCHAHVGALLAAQEQLQETVDQLVAGAFVVLLEGCDELHCIY